MNPPTIDEILRRDAERWQSPTPPPLDEALDHAIGRRRRVATTTWLAAAAVVLTVAAASALIGVHHFGVDQPADGSSTTPSAISGGVPPGYVLEHSASFPGVTLVEGAVLPGDDPREVDVVVSGLNPSASRPWPPQTCGFYKPVARVLAQGARAVQVQVSGDVLVPRHTGSGQCGDNGPWLVLPVQLNRPLGSRTLRVGSSVIYVLPARPPAPSYLPVGFVSDGVQHPDPGNVQFVSASDYRNPAGDRLVVRIGPYDEVTPAGPRRDPVTVNRAPGSFSGGRGHQPLCLTFAIPSTAFNGVNEQVCMAGRPDSAPLRHELLRVARSLPQK